MVAQSMLSVCHAISVCLSSQCCAGRLSGILGFFFTRAGLETMVHCLLTTELNYVARAGTCMARALEAADTWVRCAAASLVPAFAVGAVRGHQKVHAAAAAALERLAGVQRSCPLHACGANT
jgi:hypothetical protein